MKAFLTIWTKPMKTAQDLIDNQSIWFGVLLTVISSLGTSVFTFADSGIFGDLSLSIILLISFSVTIVFTFLLYFFNAGVYLLISKMLGGRGTYKRVALAATSGSLPMLAVLPLSIVTVAIYREQLYMELLDPFAISNMATGFYALYMILILGLSIFGIVILSRALGYANGFSAGRGFGVVLIYGAFLFAIAFVLVIIAFIIGLFFWSALI